MAEEISVANNFLVHPNRSLGRRKFRYHGRPATQLCCGIFTALSGFLEGLLLAMWK